MNHVKYNKTQISKHISCYHVERKELHGVNNIKLIERSIVGDKSKFILQSDRLPKSNNCEIGLGKLSPAL